MAYRFVKIVKTGTKTEDWTDRGYGLKSGEERKPYPIKAQGFVLDRVEPDAATEAIVREEAALWVIEDHYYYHTYHEGHDVTDTDRGVDARDVASLASHIIVKDGHFYGVVLCVENTSGNGWNGYSYESNCLLLVDGTIVGKNEKSYHFSGEETETTKENKYYLKKRG